MVKRWVKTAVPTQFEKDLIEAVLEGRVGLDAYHCAWQKATGHTTLPSYPDMNLSARVRFLKEKFELGPEPIKRLLPIFIRRRIRTSDDLEEFIRGRKKEVKKVGELRRVQQNRLKSHIAVRAFTSMGIEITSRSKLNRRLGRYRQVLQAILKGEVPDKDTLGEMKRFFQQISRLTLS